MELPKETIEQLQNLFIAANRPEKEIREEATSKIQKFVKETPNSIITLLVFQNLKTIDAGARTLSAITFKNLVKDSWVDGDEVENPIPSNDKEMVKSLLLNFILSAVNNTTQSQLVESLSMIGVSDFPQQWPSILPELIKQMESNTDIPTLSIILRVLHSLLKKYRGQERNNQSLSELKYILSILPTPYLSLLIKTGVAVDANLQNEQQLVLLLNCVHFLLEIFFSMSSVDLPEFFEDNLASFTNEFHRYLKFNTNFQSIILSSNDEEPSLLKKIQTSICEIINLYTQIYDEEFSSFLQPFVQVVWGLLTQTSKDICNDPFVYASIRFLGTVATSISHKIFESPETLKQICSMIVTPNIELRESDIELYEDNHVEYMRRDIEGSDSDTRRRAAIELVKGLRKYYENQVIQLLSVDINNLLQKYNSNREENWICKDSAIFLVTALAVKSGGSDESSESSKLVNVLDFFKSSIEPELSGATQTNKPILKADCLKFITIFRNQIPAEEYPRILQSVIPCLENPDFIIHTYASTCIDRLLSVKDGGVPRLSAEFISTNLTGLLLPLVGVFNFKDSKQNERAMRTIVRIVLMTQGKVSQQITIQLLQKFVSIIIEEAKNPSNHSFNHYCFEVVGTLLKGFSSEPEVTQIIMPLIEMVLQTNNAEFSPYCFQLLSILVENCRPEYLDLFRPILPIIFNDMTWARDADYPALVRLLQAFIKKEGSSIAPHLSAILGITEKLIMRVTHDHEAFLILETVVETLDIQFLEKYLGGIFSMILTRITKKKTLKVVRCFTIFFSIFMIKYGVVKTAQTVRAIKDSLWEDILIKLWLPTVEDINGSIEKKIISISLTNMICCNDILATPELWIKLIQCQSNVISGKKSQETEQAGAASDLYIDQAEANEGYVPTFTQLQFSKKVDVDPFPTISNPKEYFISTFQTFKSQNEMLVTPLLSTANIQL
ncbi:hypothetical protein DDB_G0291838 [Dictyostelium discoideum AX4]|uniref:Exportin-2 n=1 Tax=Dictyostelium discoideum TaxID=44689 RepID=XPO2_DICDI|nr:hypothetical protein DDB_G0291838 [Dictyostelium discoideum AX4]Q54E36.1 RecName: Full=Exportin-2; Short=Exp2; AltName: Full=Importin-alpha re-exporter [Dictyostelium discoideum]EAL61540.1 hypothetical protein DDB_G0291838 [Dictyostelium discoideum AX4]|eukprot:XP_629951.1 hypothetical protein DDB_G0291838 [Dictyostelium discoideum AX4]